MYCKQYLDVVKAIDDGLTSNEICISLGISKKQLYYYLQSLKNGGIDFNRKYYSNGVIKYIPIKKSRDLESSDYVKLITPLGSNEETFLVLSDTHLGHEKERLDLLDRSYNYAVKNDIHVILFAGDLIDGTYTKGIRERDREDLFQQIEHFIKDYPHDDRITNIMVLGDHDYSALTTYYLNLKEIINNRRHDLVVGGYNNTNIELKNDKIMLFHHIDGGFIPNKEYYPIIIKGHTHNYSSIKRDDGVLYVSAPAISDVMETHPSALILNVSFKDGYINEADVKQLLFLDKDYIISTNRFEFKRNNLEKINPIKNEEYFYEERDIMDLIGDVSLEEDKELILKRG